MTWVVSEYVFVCDPLGLMCLTDSGQALWIQLEDEETLYGLADFLDESEWDPVEIELVRQKEAAVDVEVASQVSVHHASCQKLTLLRESPYFGAAVFPMTNLPKDMSLVGHSGWLAANGNTRVV